MEGGGDDRSKTGELNQQAARSIILEAVVVGKDARHCTATVLRLLHIQVCLTLFGECWSFVPAGNTDENPK